MVNIGDNALVLDFNFYIDTNIQPELSWRNDGIHQRSPFHEEAAEVKIAKVPARD